MRLEVQALNVLSNTHSAELCLFVLKDIVSSQGRGVLWGEETPVLDAIYSARYYALAAFVAVTLLLYAYGPLVRLGILGWLADKLFRRGKL